MHWRLAWQSSPLPKMKCLRHFYLTCPLFLFTDKSLTFKPWLENWSRVLKLTLLNNELRCWFSITVFYTKNAQWYLRSQLIRSQSFINYYNCSNICKLLFVLHLKTRDLFFQLFLACILNCMPVSDNRYCSLQLSSKMRHISCSILQIKNTQNDASPEYHDLLMEMVSREMYLFLVFVK